MSFMHLTFLYWIITFFSNAPVSEYPSSVHETRDVLPGATNIIYQSKDGGQTWEDISFSLPENEQPEDFFAGESEIYLRVNKTTYRSKTGLNTPVWEKDNVLDRGCSPIAFNRFEVMNRAESEGVIIGTGQRGIRRSADNGEHWEWVITDGGVGIAVERIDGGFAAIVYSNSARSRRIYISRDLGKTWKTIDEGLQPSLSISSIKQVGPYLLCGHPDGIFRSPDMGKTWTMVHPSVEPAFGLSGNAWNPLRDNRKVFKLFVSGKVVYAVARDAGC